MGNLRGTTPGTAQRKSVTRRGSTTNQRVVTRDGIDVNEQENAAQEAANRTNKVQVMADTSLFQLNAERERLHASGYREVIPERVLKFVRGKAIGEVTDEDIATVDAIIKGEHSDGRVTGLQFQKNARLVNLRLVHPGIVRIPMPTWSTLPGDQVVQVALAAGVLTDARSIENAITYEQQSPLRTVENDRRDVREEVIDRLVSLRQALTGEVQVPSAEDAAARVVNSGIGQPPVGGSDGDDDSDEGSEPEQPSQPPAPEVPARLSDEDRKALEARAVELNVSFQPNIGDAKLQKRVEDAEKAAAVNEAGTATQGASSAPDPGASSGSEDKQAAQAAQSAPGLTPKPTQN